MKNVWKCSFKAYTRVSFSNFPKVALNRGWREYEPTLFTIFVDHVDIQFKPYAKSKMELFMKKNR